MATPGVPDGQEDAEDEDEDEDNAVRELERELDELNGESHGAPRQSGRKKRRSDPGASPSPPSSPPEEYPVVPLLPCEIPPLVPVQAAGLPGQGRWALERAEVEASRGSVSRRGSCESVTTEIVTQVVPPATTRHEGASEQLKKVASRCCPGLVSFGPEVSRGFASVRASSRDFATNLRKRGAVKRQSAIEKLLNADAAGEMWYSIPDQPFILHPNSKVRMCWDFIALLMILMEGITMPFSVGFDTQVPAVMSWMSVSFFGLDILMNLVTGFFQDGIIIMKWRAILKNYGRSWLVLDVTSTIPWSVIAPNGEGTNATILRFSKVGKFLRIVKLLRFAKLNILLQTFEEFFYSPTLIISLKLAKIIGMISLLVHWTACIWGFLGDATRYDQFNDIPPHDPAQCTEGGPCEPGITGSPWRRRWGVEQEPIESQYLYALRWATGLFTGSDIGIQPGFWPERIFAVMVSFASFLLLSTIISKVVIMFEKINQEHADQDEVMMQFKEFMAQSKVPLQLQAKVRRYLEYQYKARRELQVRRFEMLDRLSPWLRKELTVHLNRAVLNLHPFFRGMPNEVQPHVCCSSQSLLCAPGDIIMQMGQNSTFMYFLVRGKLELTREPPLQSCDSGPRTSTSEATAFKLVAPGYIGADCIFQEQMLKYTVKCISHCELLKITMEEVHHLQQEFPALNSYMLRFEGSGGARSDMYWDCSPTAEELPELPL